MFNYAIYKHTIAADLVRRDKTACLLNQRQAKDERNVHEAIDDFRQNFQQLWSRREFDLNDPDSLKTQQDGNQMPPGLVGEDLDSKSRLMKQREQLRVWSLQHHQDQYDAWCQQRKEDQRYDRRRVQLDEKAFELQQIEEERRKGVTVATKNFNLTKAAETAERRQREWQLEQEDNQTDVLNQLQGPLLREGGGQAVGEPGAERRRADTELVRFHRQQAQEKKRLELEQEKEKLQQERLLKDTNRAAMLLDRQQARLTRQRRQDMDNANAELAEAHLSQKKYLEKVYANTADESYFSQFNTSSR
ncbi:RIB43A-like with coiled-coils protein 2 [Aplochiton taeniatus]